MSELSSKPLPRKNTEAVNGVFFWVAAFMFLGLPLLIIIGGLCVAQRQHHIVTTYQPGRANVLSSEVKHWKDSHGAYRYNASIRYQYEVNGKTYQSDEISPIYESSSQEWADSLVATYRAGQPCDAYYDPANPGKAVLLRRYFFLPYKFLLEGAFMVTLGCFAVLGLWFQRQPKLTPADNGWFAISPQLGQRDRLLTAKVCVIVWYVVTSIGTAHYLVFGPPQHNDIDAFEFFYALGLVPILYFIHCWRLNRNMDEARVLVDQPEGMLGRRLRFSVTQLARRRLELKQARIRLRCLGSKNKSNSVLFEMTLAEVKENVLHAGEPLTLSREITLPVNQPPSGRDRTGKFDRIRWKLLLQCQLRGAPYYSTEYRLEVKGPPTEIPVETPELVARTTARAEIRAIEPEFAGRIMSRRNFAFGLCLESLPIVIQLAGGVLLILGFGGLFPGTGTGPKLLPNTPKPQLYRMIEIGGALAVVGSIWGIAWPGRLRFKYFLAVAKREIKRRRDTVVQPDAKSHFVKIVPRENWNRSILKEQKDCGFLTVDASGREIRFEGENERYRIPADAILSCDVVKSVYFSNAKPTAPGYFMVVLRAQTTSGILEAPVAPWIPTNALNSKSRQRAAEVLQAKIKALNPAMVPQETSIV